MRKFFLVFMIIFAYFSYQLIFHYSDVSSFDHAGILSNNLDEGQEEVDEEEATVSFQEPDYDTPPDIDYDQIQSESQVSAETGDDLVEQYENEFERLEQSILTEIENLRDVVLEEVDLSEGLFSQGMNLLQYEREANDIEAEADQQFEELTSHLEEAVNEYGLSDEIVDEFKDRYHSKKDEIKNDIFDEVNSWLSERE
ncbi:hypothetical protein [Alkalibacillus aidingensis]|uniref:hypothetical protein n=1 Tax=Alkalibacillus aidingensis TaxID=2747607 RepID=UPI0016606E31|nr:hypothetical protein [Alkalibacillus aidingensis]